jgi:formate hydrogenlyase transcriptional activator
MGREINVTAEAAIVKARKTVQNMLSEQAEHPLGRDEMQRLVHQLEVHQIELESQNAELRRVYEELEVSRNNFAELYDFAPVGYFTFDTDGVIRESNLAGARLLGVERGLLVGRPFSRYIADAQGREFFPRYLESVTRRTDPQQCELLLSGKDGCTVHALLRSVTVDGSRKKKGYLHVLCSIVDDTLARKLKDDLQKAHDKLELTVAERTRELAGANRQLTREIVERKEAQALLQDAYLEIKGLRDRLQAENVYLQREVARQFNFGEIIGGSEALAQVTRLVEQVAPMNATVLLLGETGTGKGVVARAIHSSSARKDRPMITVNCTTLPASLVESELFGREKGAFTGAFTRQIGRFELADGGTVFLDEVGEMPFELQSKLLRVIQDGEFERLGGTQTLKSDLRIIAATNRDLEQEVRAGRFRQDLFYRLNVFPITLPPLRERRDDIPLLVAHFLAKFNKKIGRQITTVSGETMKALQDYRWPGNVRELESVVERAVITSQGSELQVLDRFDNLYSETAAAAAAVPERGAGGQEVKALAALEYDHILSVLLKTGWRIEGENGAAGILGINASTLRARMRKLGIVRS